MLILFIGPPASGKTSLLKLLMTEFPNKVKVISTGDFARSLRSREFAEGDIYSDLQNQFNHESEILKQQGESGRRVSDDIMNKFVKRVYQQSNRNNLFMVLDGFPRTLQQAQFITSFVQNLTLVETSLEKNVAQERYLGRERADAIEEAFNKRFDEYNHSRDAIVDTLLEKNTQLLVLDSEKNSLEENYQRLRDFIIL